MITEKNIVNHELIGLFIECIECTNKANKGIKGKIINETRNMLWVKQGDEVKKLEKGTCLFRIKTDSGKQVEIPGSVLVGRPEERLKKKWIR